MQYSELIYLISSNELERDKFGNYIPSKTTSKKCYAKKQSVRTSEFYNAIESGLNPSVEFVIKRLNYSGEEELNWNNHRYSIIRTIDPKNKFDIVLVCSAKVGVNE